MLVSQIKKIVLGLLVVGLGVVLIGCGSGSGGISEAKSAVAGVGSADGKTQTTNGGSGGVTVTSIYSQPKQLGAGDILYADFSKSSSLDFSGVSSGAEFTFVVANASSGNDNLSVQISGDLSDASLDLDKSAESATDEGYVAEDKSNDITEKFHEILRLREHQLESLDIPSQSFSASKAMADATSIAEGDKKTFKVLSSLSSSTNTVDVKGVADCVGTNVAFYVDERVTDSMLSNAEVKALCSQFDATVIKEQELFGAMSDVDNNGKVIVLMTPQVNMMGAAAGGIVTGFFKASDLYPNSSSNPSSNYMEILYIMVPDPSGAFGVAISKSFALANLLPAVLPHEFQHAINYNQHVFVAKGASEDPWINEGLSHLAEDLFGQGQENPSRYAIFLRNPSAYSLVASSTPGLAVRGAAYLFLRYLYEQSSDGNLFLKKMLQSPLKGTSNIEAAFSGRSGDFDQFGEFFLRWTAALAMTDAGISQDRRFTYKPRVKDTSTGQWDGVCLRCNADDGRGTVLSGVAASSYSGSQSTTTASSAARFYKISNVKDKLSFSGASSSNGFGILIRTK